MTITEKNGSGACAPDRQTLEQRSDISALRKRFRYEPESGKLFGRWGHQIKPTARASVWIGEGVVLGTRLCFMLNTGRWPENIRVLNGDRSDWRFSNLLEFAKGDPVGSHRLFFPFETTVGQGFVAPLVSDGETSLWMIEGPSHEIVWASRFLKSKRVVTADDFGPSLRQTRLDLVQPDPARGNLVEFNRWR